MAVAEMVTRCRGDELSPDELRSNTFGDHRQRFCLDSGDVLVLYGLLEVGLRIRLGQRMRETATDDLRNSADALHEGERLFVACPIERDRQTVRSHGHLMIRAPLCSRSAICDGLRQDVLSRRAGVQQPSGVARDLADVIRLDPAAKARPHGISDLHSCWFGQRHNDLVAIDGNGVTGDVLFALSALSCAHIELPVVPLTDHGLAGECTRHQTVSLVWARVVECVHTRGSPDDGHAVFAYLGQFHLTDAEFGEGCDDRRCGARGFLGLRRGAHGMHRRSSSTLEVKEKSMTTPPPPHKDDLLTVGQVAERSGIATSAVRYYDDEGLISSSRTSGGQRRFNREALRRIAFILAAQRVRRPLAEIRETLDSLPAEVPDQADWSRVATDWKERLDDHIEQLATLRDKLDECIGCGCLSLERCAIYNPEDTAVAFGAGPRYLLGDAPSV